MRLFKQKRDINTAANDIKIGSTIYITERKLSSQKGDGQQHKIRTAWTVKKKLQSTLLVERQDSRAPHMRLIPYKYVAALLNES